MQRWKTVSLTTALLCLHKPMADQFFPSVIGEEKKTETQITKHLNHFI